MRKAIFLDRDGVINIDKGYVHQVKDFIFCNNLFKALNVLQEEGFLLFIVTNQSGIGRGFYTESQYQTLTKWMLKKLEKNGILITKVYHCPHAPEVDCQCRKPKPGMLIEAIREFNINPEISWVIGDKESDLSAGKGAGITNLILINHEKAEKPQSLFDTISLILGK